MLRENLDPAVEFCLEAIVPGMLSKDESNEVSLTYSKTKRGYEADKVNEVSLTYSKTKSEETDLSEEEKDRMVAELLSGSPVPGKAVDIDVDKVVDSEIERVLKEIL